MSYLKKFLLVGLADCPLRFHGNGFIQCQLDDFTRLHVWHPNHPPIPDHNAFIHDHVWGMESVVLAGKLEQVTYSFRRAGNGDYDLYDVGKEGEAGLGECREAGFLTKTGSYKLCPGSEYSMAADEFHSSHSEEITATLMTKVQVPLDKMFRPRVVCPRGQYPVDAFAAHRDGQKLKSEMFRAIEDAIDDMDSWARDRLADAFR